MNINFPGAALPRPNEKIFFSSKALFFPLHLADIANQLAM